MPKKRSNITRSGLIEVLKRKNKGVRSRRNRSVTIKRKVRSPLSWRPKKSRGRSR